MSGITQLFYHPVRDIVDLLPRLDQAWGEEDWRQTMPFSPHKDSQTIFLRRQPGLRPRDVLNQLLSVETPHCDHPPLIRAIKAITGANKGARAMLVRLAPGGVIGLHTDIGFYADVTERFHLPIVTNSASWLEVDGERFYLPVGLIHSFNKHLPHQGMNEGTTPRIHLIVDIFPEPSVVAG